MSTISSGTTSTTTLIHSGDTTGSLVFKTNDTGSGGTTAVTINTSQGVEFNAGTAALPSITTTGDTNTGIFFPAADTIAFAEGGAEAMRIDSSGNLLVGTTSFSQTPSQGFAFQNTSNSNLSIGHANGTASGHGFAIFAYNGGLIGSITQNGTTSTSFNTSSDYRLKENVQPMQGALATVAQLKPCTYTWKADGSDGEGFIAHELQEVVPQCVTGEKDAVDAEGNPQYQGIDTSFLVATLTAAIQEQQAMIQELKAEFDAYKASHP